MVITVIEAIVEPDRVADLEEAYRDACAELPPEIIETFLARNAYEASKFQMLTVWRSREELVARRESGAPSTGLLIFQAAGATPTHQVLDVLDSSRQ